MEARYGISRDGYVIMNGRSAVRRSGYEILIIILYEILILIMKGCVMEVLLRVWVSVDIGAVLGR